MEPPVLGSAATAALTSSPMQSSTNETSAPESSFKVGTTCFKERAARWVPSSSPFWTALGRPMWLIKMALFPELRIILMVGMAPRILESSVILSPSIGTLKSTRTRMFLASPSLPRVSRTSFTLRFRACPGAYVGMVVGIFRIDFQYLYDGMYRSCCTRC